MNSAQVISRQLAIDLLDSYPEDRLLCALSRADALDLLTGSLILRNRDPKAVHINEWKPIIFSFLAEYLARTDPEDVAIPMLLVEGSVEYYFETGDTAAPPLVGYMDAPFINFYIPFAFGTRVILPNAGSSPGSVGIIVHPDRFKAIANRNTWVYDIVMKDRHRLIAMFLKWSSIHATFSHANRLARFLYASLPDRYQPTETLTMTQAEIARLLGLSRATLAKAIATLFDAGIIQTGRGAIHINTARLKEYVQNRG